MWAAAHFHVGQGGKSTMKNEIKIAVIGDFESERPSHKATNAALDHAADSLSITLTADWLSTPSLETEIEAKNLKYYHGIFCAPGGPYKSMTGALEAIRFARERGWPLIGT